MRRAMLVTATPCDVGGEDLELRTREHVADLSRVEADKLLVKERQQTRKRRELQVTVSCAPPGIRRALSSSVWIRSKAAYSDLSVPGESPAVLHEVFRDYWQWSAGAAACETIIVGHCSENAARSAAAAALART